MLTAIFSGTNIVNATPVTFQFEAEVSDKAESIPFDSGLAVNIGDVISGSFTFQPEVAPGQQSLEAVQPFSSSLLIDGVSLIASPTAMLSLQSLNDNGIEDFQPAQSIDTIEVFTTITPAIPQDLPNVDGERSFFRIRLLGNSSILDLPGLPAENSVWNSFEFVRSLTVDLRGKSGGSLIFSARIGRFTTVPEPKFGAYAFCVFAVIIVCRYFR